MTLDITKSQLNSLVAFTFHRCVGSDLCGNSHPDHLGRVELSVWCDMDRRGLPVGQCSRLPTMGEIVGYLGAQIDAFVRGGGICCKLHHVCNSQGHADTDRRPCSTRLVWWGSHSIGSHYHL